MPSRGGCRPPRPAGRRRPRRGRARGPPPSRGRRPRRAAGRCPPPAGRRRRWRRCGRAAVADLVVTVPEPAPGLRAVQHALVGEFAGRTVRMVGDPVLADHLLGRAGVVQLAVAQELHRGVLGRRGVGKCPRRPARGSPAAAGGRDGGPRRWLRPDDALAGGPGRRRRCARGNGPAGRPRMQTPLPARTVPRSSLDPAVGEERGQGGEATSEGPRQRTVRDQGRQVASPPPSSGSSSSSSLRRRVREVGRSSAFTNAGGAVGQAGGAAPDPRRPRAGPTSASSRSSVRGPPRLSSGNGPVVGHRPGRRRPSPAGGRRRPAPAVARATGDAAA